MYKIENTVKSTIKKDTPNPFLKDHYKLIFNENTADTATLEVIGEVPQDLQGLYVSNGQKQVH